jgi:hypothetical protein
MSVLSACAHARSPDLYLETLQLDSGTGLRAVLPPRWVDAPGRPGELRSDWWIAVCALGFPCADPSAGERP